MADQRNGRGPGEQSAPRTWRVMVLAALLVVAGAVGLAGVVASTPGPPTAGTLAYGNRPSLAAFLRQEDNIPYDGRFTFVRIRFRPAGTGRCFGGGQRGEPSWQHDYPYAEQHLMEIMSGITYLESYQGGSNILWTDDEELFRYPLAYVSEPGCWTMGEDEVQGLRDYLLKGGFLIFDDFRGRDWFNFRDQLLRVLPDANLVELDASHEIFHSFFEIDQRVLDSTGRGWSWPRYYGVFEDNDPSKRLMLIANYDNDIGDYWEWSGSGYLPIDLTNDAYKLGVNYIVYAMTH